MTEIHLISDTTSDQDLLNFKRYVDPLIQILENRQTQTPFSIGVFGPWGSGKSTLIDYLDRQLAKSIDIEFYRIKFNPWIYRSERNLIVPLLHTIQDDLAHSLDQRIVAAAKKIGTVLARVGAALFLKTVTANQITLEDVEKQEKVYMEQYRRAKSEIRNLRSQLQEIVDDITNRGQSTADRQAGRVIFFIDDLDRCQPDQIVALLEAIKLFLDLKHCFFIIALDEEVIHRAIQIKYNEFHFSEERKNQIGREYLEKMIQLPLYLYPLSEGEMKEYLDGLALPVSIADQISLFARILLPNPRKVKRILNLFLLNLGVLKTNAELVKQLDLEVLARLITIQVQDYDLYAAILKHKDLPLYLSRVYRNELQFTDRTQWSKLGPRRDEVLELCQRYHRPDTWLERTFARDAFPQPEQLEKYFNMLGQVVRS
jgi:hypothetical protein